MLWAFCCHNSSHTPNIVETRTSFRGHGVRERFQVYTPLFKITTGMCSVQSRGKILTNFRNCGLFRYWTLSNLPLFFLAAPMFTILITSSLWGLTLTLDQLVQIPDKADNVQKTVERPVLQVIRNLAFSQLMLVMLTLTTAHVQIITRISSAYPIWMWYTASSWRKGNTLLVRSIVKFMVVYSIVQGGLFASFLPPA